jgi:outer membrane immunogenic protein
MHHVRCAAFAAVAIIGFASVASAADLPSKTPVYKAPAVVPAPVQTWTSCYVGGNGGYGWTNKQWHSDEFGYDAGSHTGTGAVGGGQIGCDYQTGQFVFGVQGMFDWADLTGSHTFPGNTHYTEHSKVSWLATLTGRFGFVVQPASLLYLKGGAAWVRDTFTETCAVSYDAECPSEAKVTRSGWTIGGGWEYQFMPNWSVFVEYNYMDFGRHTSSLVSRDGYPWDVAIKQDVQTASVGVNYRFGGR